MTLNGWIQIAIYCAIVLALVKPFGWYMARVFNGERTFLSPVLRPVESGLYRLGGVDEKREQTGSPTRSPCCSFMRRLSRCLHPHARARATAASIRRA